MPKQGQQKGTPVRRAEFIEHLRSIGPGAFCVNWPWSRVRDRYAVIHVDGQKVLAHRWVYEQFNGPIPKQGGRGPDSPVVMHTCDNRACVRPSHLRLGTQQDNIRDAFEKGRMIGGPGFGDRRRKLTDFDVAVIRSLKANGAVQHHIALHYGVSDAAISQIVNGKNRLPPKA